MLANGQCPSTVLALDTVCCSRTLQAPPYCSHMVVHEHNGCGSGGTVASLRECMHCHACVCVYEYLYLYVPVLVCATCKAHAQPQSPAAPAPAARACTQRHVLHRPLMHACTDSATHACMSPAPTPPSLAWARTGPRNPKRGGRRKNTRRRQLGWGRWTSTLGDGAIPVCEGHSPGEGCACA